MTPILCYYTNSTNQLQQIRLIPRSHPLFDRLVFPGEKFMFEAASDGALEIYTHTTAGLHLSNRIDCLRLKVRQRQQAELEI